VEYQLENDGIYCDACNESVADENSNFTAIQNFLSRFTLILYLLVLLFVASSVAISLP
jgi:hypothetical protein